MARETHDRRERSLRRLRHHLEDEVDRDLERLFGDGKARRRDSERRQEQYARLAERLFQIVLNGELRDPALEGLVVDHVELHGSSSILTLWVALRSGLDDRDREEIERQLDAARGLLRAELARHLPRKRVPDVRVRVLDGAEGGLDG